MRTSQHCVGTNQMPFAPGPMPPDFPLVHYEAVAAAVNARLPAADPQSNFTGGWLAVAFRFDGAVMAADGLHRSLNAHGAAPAHPHRSEQEHALFVFFSSAASVFDSLHYALFSVGAHISPMNFPMATEADLKNISNVATARRYRAAFPSDPLVSALNAFADDAGAGLLSRQRNVLTHRIVFGRTHELGSGLPSTLANGDVICGTMLDGHRATLARCLEELTRSAEDFTSRHL